jgi:hypothetical protein
MFNNKNAFESKAHLAEQAAPFGLRWDHFQSTEHLNS